MATAERLLTVEEYFAIPDKPRHTQLVAGQIIVDEPSGLHQIVQGNLYSELRAWIRGPHGFGRVLLPQDLPLTRIDSFAPDVLWWADASRHDLSTGRQYELPELVVEVRSPRTWRYDVGHKRAIYEKAGVPELWLVDTSATSVLVYRRSRPDAPGFDVSAEVAEGALTSPALPGFTLPVEEVFAP